MIVSQWYSLDDRGPWTRPNPVRRIQAGPARDDAASARRDRPAPLRRDPEFSAFSVFDILIIIGQITGYAAIAASFAYADAEWTGPFGLTVAFYAAVTLVAAIRGLYRTSALEAEIVSLQSYSRSKS